MRELILKDVRLYRPVVWSTLGLAVLFWGVLPLMSYASRRYSAFGGGATFNWQDAATGMLDGAAMFWLAVPVLAGVIGAMAFAVERGEGWADFLGLLPVPRRHAVFAKTIAAAIVSTGVLLLVGGGTIVFFATVRVVSRRDALFFRANGPLESIQYFLSAAALIFGASWLLSAILRSSVYAAVIAISLCGVTFVGLVNIVRGPYPFVFVDVNEFAALLGVVFWIAGTLVQLWRKTP